MPRAPCILSLHRNHFTSIMITRNSLNSKIRSYYSRQIIVMIILMLVGIWIVSYFAVQSNKAYLSRSTAKVADDISSYLNTVSYSSFGISTDNSFISYYSNIANRRFTANSDVDISNLYDNVNSICAQIPSVSDVIIIDSYGNGKSYFSGYSYIAMQDIEPNIYDIGNTDRGYYFFPQASQFSQNYFIYYFPIMDFLEISNVRSSKIATAIFFISKRQLSEYINSDPEDSVFYTIRFNSAPVISSATNRYEKELLLLSTSIDINRSGAFQIIGTSNWLGSPDISLSILFAFILSVAAVVIISNHLLRQMINQRLVSPVNSIIAQLKKNELQPGSSGDNNLLPSVSASLKTCDVDEFNIIILQINQYIRQLTESTSTIQKNQQKMFELEIENKRAELYALQSQMNPHFLYNTLECINGLATEKRFEEIQSITRDISSFYQYSIQPAVYVRLSDEIMLTYRYLNIQKIRLNNRLKYTIDLPESILDCFTIRMLIQPIVENSIQHGLSGITNPRIEISGDLEDENKILISVLDNGKGMNRTTLKNLRSILLKSFNDNLEQETTHLGLYNINRRIKLMLGEEYGLAVNSNSNGTEVFIRIPRLMNVPEDKDTSGVNTLRILNLR